MLLLTKKKKFLKKLLDILNIMYEVFLDTETTGLSLKTVIG